MPPAMNTVMLRELAEGSRYAGSSLGSTADRVGWLIAKNACCTAKRPSSSQTFSRPSAACTQKQPLVTIRPIVVIISSLRRSIASARAPPHSPKTMSGTRPNTPVSPTYAEEPVMA